MRCLHCCFGALVLVASSFCSRRGEQHACWSLTCTSTRSSYKKYQQLGVVGFLTTATTAAAFVTGPPQQSQQPRAHPIETKKDADASSSACLESSHADDNDAPSASCSSSDESRLIADSNDSRTSRSSTNKDPNNFELRKDMSNYHLIWSPGAFKKMSITTFCLLVLPVLIPQSWKEGLFSSSFWIFKQATPCHVSTTSATTASSLFSFWGRNFVLPLAASSCCLLQLGLNLINFGCAGWNTKLGPFRPYFLSLLLFTLDRQRPLSFLTVAWQVSVALLPEIVHLYNEYAPSFITQPRRRSQQSAKANDTLLYQVDVNLDIPTMGCVGCIQTINHALRQQDHVVSASSELKPFGASGGQATIRLGIDSNAQDDVSQQVQALIQAVERAGFDGATAASVRTSSQKKRLAAERLEDDENVASS